MDVVDPVRLEGFEQGMAVAVEQAMPVYLRDKVAKKESER